MHIECFEPSYIVCTLLGALNEQTNSNVDDEEDEDVPG